MSGNNENKIDPLQLLSDDLKEENYEGIIQAINRLTTVGKFILPHLVTV